LLQNILEANLYYLYTFSKLDSLEGLRLQINFLNHLFSTLYHIIFSISNVMYLCHIYLQIMSQI